MIDCYFDDPRLTMLPGIPSLPTMTLSWACDYFDQENNGKREAVPVLGLTLNWPGSFCFLAITILALGIVLGSLPSHREANESAMWRNHIENQGPGQQS